MNNYSSSLSKILSFSERILDDLFIKKQPETLYAPINHILSKKGKQIRSILALLSYNMFGGKLENLKEIILALETLHNFTLIHDDVMDNAELRRGQTTINYKWSNSQAILSGDVFLMQAYDYFLQSKITTKKDLQDFIQTSILICEGQQLDFDFQKNPHIKIEDYHKMIELKTGVLIQFSLVLPASLSNSSQNNLDIMHRIGVSLGNLFQIQDDYLDLYGEKQKVGKRIGGDILEKKKTFLYFTALNLGSLAQNNFLKLVYHSDEKDYEDKVIQLYATLGVKQYVEKEIIKISHNILEEISILDVSTKQKETFLEFVSIILKRDF